MLRPFVYSLPLVVAAASFFACVTPPLETVQPAGQNVVRWPISLTPRDKIDILFMVDNSGSMDAMQAELRNRFGQFFEPFQRLARGADGKKADLHIGVVTSDFGAGHGVSNSCSPSPGGQRGKLQALGSAAPTSCRAPRGSNWIEYKFGDDGAPVATNLPDGQDLVTTFTCMASVGSKGCGFEHPLESVYSALHDAIPDNQGFLRDEALLVVVFLTNEDDASAPPDTDIFDSGAPYHPLYSYARQTSRAIVCCPPGVTACSDGELTFPPYASSNGPLAGCRPAPNLPTGAGPGKQYDVSRYVDFFTRPQSQGGVKKSANDVILVGIDAPDDTFEVVLSNPGTPSGPYPICTTLEETGQKCVPVLQHSCVSSQHPAFFGDPAVRLNTVIRAAKSFGLYSICDDDYSKSLADVAALVISSIGDGCVKQALPRDPSDPSRLRPECSVDEVSPNDDGTETRSLLPQCPEGGAAELGAPCWKIEAKASCDGFSPDGVGFTVDRGSAAPPPAGTTAEISCAFD